MLAKNPLSALGDLHAQLPDVHSVFNMSGWMKPRTPIPSRFPGKPAGVVISSSTSGNSYPPTQQRNCYYSIRTVTRNSTAQNPTTPILHRQETPPSSRNAKPRPASPILPPPHITTSPRCTSPKIAQTSSAQIPAPIRARAQSGARNAVDAGLSAPCSSAQSPSLSNARLHGEAARGELAASVDPKSECGAGIAM